MLQTLDTLPAGAPISASLVWVRVLEEDDQQTARAIATQFQHPRLQHFYDPRQLAAREMAAALGGAGHFAWDVYLVFPAGATWYGVPPQPSDWVHQLDHTAWAPAERRRKGDALLQALEKMLAHL